jgi:predicted kinase
MQLSSAGEAGKRWRPSSIKPAKRRREVSCEMAASLGVSCQLRVEFCTAGCEDRISAREAEESPLLEAVARKRLVKRQQAGKRLSAGDL